MAQAVGALLVYDPSTIQGFRIGLCLVCSDVTALSGKVLRHPVPMVRKAIRTPIHSVQNCLLLPDFGPPPTVLSPSQVRGDREVHKAVPLIRIPSDAHSDVSALCIFMPCEASPYNAAGAALNRYS